MRFYSDEQTFMDAKATSGKGKAFYCKDYQNLVLTINTALLTDGTVKIQKAISQAEPNWAAAASPTNRWSYVQVADENTGSTINGDTGVTPAGKIDKSYNVETNGATWINVITSGQTAGTYTVKGVGYGVS